MFPQATRVRLHRFHDSLAVSFCATDSSGRPVPLPTVYLPAGMVEALALSAAEFLRDFARASFTGSEFATRAHGIDGARVPE